VTTSTSARRSAAASPSPTRSRTRRAGRLLLVVAFWLAVWQVAALVVGHDLLLAAPGDVAVRLGPLVLTPDFWSTVAHTLVRIVAGFVIGAAVGVGAAVLAAAWRPAEALLTPLATVVRTMPVVSFIILVLIWADSSRLAVVISALMVTPVLYATTLEGIRSRDHALLEMVAVFRVPLRRRLAAVDLPAVVPFLLAGSQVAVGLAWKSGVAAEVIGLPQGSIGERLYQAKIWLSTADLFAWTVVVVLLSLLVERGIVALLRRAQGRRAPGAVDRLRTTAGGPS
jgi:NitT/TauT family transport system permease protein